MKYQQSSKREEKSKFITNQLTNMAHIPIQSYLYLLLGTTLFSCAPQELKTPFELKCENIPVPVGVDTQTPRLSWKLPLLEEDSINRVEIWLSTDSTQLSGRQSGYWNKSIIGAPIRVSYDGQPLDSYTTYYWKIGYQTSSKQKTTFSPISSFTTGCLSSDNWKGKWITDKHDITYRPAPYYRKSFQLDKTIEQALLTIASAGLHELSVNGQRAGNHFLDPMYTHFDKRILSVTHDVTSLLSLGENVIGVQLGNGWYNHQSTAVWFFDKASWRNRPKFTAQLHLRYTDGTTEYLGTDSTWQTTDSPVIFNSIYTAEHYDAQKELAGWDSPGFNATGWYHAQETESPTETIKSQVMHPIRETARYTATQCKKINDSCYVYHFPKNIAGVTELKVKGKKGTKLRLKHGELLDKNGMVNMANIDYHYRPTDDSDPFQTDIVILSGKQDRFMPKFNYKGFQFVEVSSSAPIQLSDENLIAVEMHSDVPAIGYWSSSSDLLNKIWKATNSSYLANLFGYPTDCPQREKNGWTGDAHIAIETGLYNFDGISIYEKWMNDFCDEQKDNGVLPCIIPTSVWGYDWANGVDWTSAVAIIPWEIYRFYGDTTLLRRMYGPIKKYVSYIESISTNHLTDWGLGDWVPVRSKSNITLTSSIYYYTDVCILAKAARLFGYAEDASYYNTLAQKIKEAINTSFLNKETGIYAEGTQTELAMPLYWGIVPEEDKKKVAARLHELVEKDDYHLDVGLLGSKALLSAMSDNGYAETAYKVASQDTYPSWGYWIKQGATTLHENWRTDVVIDNSYNHIMFGEIGAWLYKGLGGIQIDEKHPGFKHILLKPFFPADMNELTIRYNTPYGWLNINWVRQTNDCIRYTIDIPAGTSATFVPFTMPEPQKSITLQAGKHSLELDFIHQLINQR